MEQSKRTKLRTRNERPEFTKNINDGVLSALPSIFVRFTILILSIRIGIEGYELRKHVAAMFSPSHTF